MSRMRYASYLQLNVNEILLRGRCLRKADDVVREQENDRRRVGAMVRSMAESLASRNPIAHV